MQRFLPAALALLALLAAPIASSAYLEQGIFRIEFDPAGQDIAAASADLLENAVAEFHHVLPAGNDPIRVVIAHDAATFRRLAGRLAQSNISGFARPHESLMVVKAPRLRRAGDDYAGTLRHELLHILLHRNINTAYLPVWLNEGICMSLANEYRWASMLQMARMFARGRIIPYRDLDLSFRAPGDELEFGDAYAQALSMTKFLRKRLGEEMFWEVVLATSDIPFGQAMREIAGWPIDEFWQAYRRSLWGVAVIGLVSSGSVFTPAAFLLIIAFLRKRMQNNRTLKRWEREEAEEDDMIVSWDDIAEGPYDWESAAQDQDDAGDEPWRRG